MKSFELMPGPGKAEDNAAELEFILMPTPRGVLVAAQRLTALLALQNAACLLLFGLAALYGHSTFWVVFALVLAVLLPTCGLVGVYRHNWAVFVGYHVLCVVCGGAAFLRMGYALVLAGALPARDAAWVAEHYGSRGRVIHAKLIEALCFLLYLALCVVCVVAADALNRLTSSDAPLDVDRLQLQRKRERRNGARPPADARQRSIFPPDEYDSRKSLALPHRRPTERAGVGAAGGGAADGSAGPHALHAAPAQTQVRDLSSVRHPSYSEPQRASIVSAQRPAGGRSSVGGAGAASAASADGGSVSTVSYAFPY